MADTTVSLPWRRARHWFAPAPPGALARRVAGAVPTAAIFAAPLAAPALAYLWHHVVGGTPLLPANAALEAAAAAARCVVVAGDDDDARPAIIGVALAAPLPLARDATLTVRVGVAGDVTVSSSSASSSKSHVTARVARVARVAAGAHPAAPRRAPLRSLLPPPRAAAATACLAPPPAGPAGAHTGVHPAPMDAATHTGAALAGGKENGGGVRVPAAVRAFYVSTPSTPATRVAAALASTLDGGAVGHFGTQPARLDGILFKRAPGWGDGTVSPPRPTAATETPPSRPPWSALTVDWAATEPAPERAASPSTSVPVHVTLASLQRGGSALPSPALLGWSPARVPPRPAADAAAAAAIARVVARETRRPAPPPAADAGVQHAPALAPTRAPARRAPTPHPGAAIAVGGASGIGALALSAHAVTTGGATLAVSRSGGSARAPRASLAVGLRADAACAACAAAVSAAALALLNRVTTLHAAGGVLADGLLPSVRPAALRSVAAPKRAALAALGATLASSPLATLALYSSLSGVLGTPGQAAYAAANAALDAVTSAGASAGLPATALQFGPWSLGMAAGTATAASTRARFAAAGLGVLTPVGGGGRAWARERQRHRWSPHSGVPGPPVDQPCAAG